MAAIAACGGRVDGDDTEEGGGSGGGATSGGATGAGEAGEGDASEGGATMGGATTGGAGSGGVTPGGTSPGGGSTPLGGTLPAGGGTPHTGGAQPELGGATPAGGTPPAGGTQPDTGGSPPAGGTPPVGGTRPDTGGSPASGAGAGGEAPLTEEDLVRCLEDADCVVVPYDHCCGATRRAINEAYRDEYEAHPEWQSFSDPEACAEMDMCLDDSDVTSASCLGAPDGSCQLVFPVQCADLDCEGVCPGGTWLDAQGCPTCSCAPPPLGMTVGGEERPVEAVTLTVTGSVYVGGINRTMLDLEWRYDDVDTEDEEDGIDVSVVLLSPPVALPLVERTFWIAPLSGGLELPTATHVVWFSDEQTPLEVTGGFLSIRPRADGDLEGGILLTTADGSEVGGSFVIPDPWTSI